MPQHPALAILHMRRGPRLGSEPLNSIRPVKSRVIAHPEIVAPRTRRPSSVAVGPRGRGCVDSLVFERVLASLCGFGAEEALEQMEREIEAAGAAACGEDVAVVDPAGVWLDVRAGGAEVVERGVVGDGRATVEEAGFGKQHRAGADARDCRSARVSLGNCCRNLAAQRLGVGARLLVARQPAAAGTINNSGAFESTASGSSVRPCTAVTVVVGWSVTSLGFSGLRTSNGPIASISSKPS